MPRTTPPVLQLFPVQRQQDCGKVAGSSNRKGQRNKVGDVLSLCSDTDDNRDYATIRDEILAARTSSACVARSPLTTPTQMS
jgi:hypothetical protein